jgi:hypothetical protein
MSYTQAMIRPDITTAVQQCARFCNNPKQEHEEAVKRICHYLMKTKDKGLTLRHDGSRGLECFVDADWAGSWQHRSCNDPLLVSTFAYRICYHVRGMPDYLGIQNATVDCLEHNGSRIYCSFYGATRSLPSYS